MHQNKSLISTLKQHRSSSLPLFTLSKENGKEEHISYEQAWNVTIQHQHFIQKQLHSLLVSSKATRTNDEEVEEVEIVIAYLSKNSPDFLLSFLASTNITSVPSHNNNTLPKCKILPTMLNTRWTANEIASALHVVGNNEAHPLTPTTQKHEHYLTMILYGEDFRDTASKALSMLNSKALFVPIPTFLTTPINSISLIHQSKEMTVETNNNKNVENNAILLFTSGTSSSTPTSTSSKAVSLSHASLMIQSFAKTQSPCNYSSETKLIASTVPFFHVGGLSSALAVLIAGGSLLFPPDSKSGGFDPRSIIQTMECNEGNTLVVVPTMISSILSHLQRKHSNKIYPSVKLILVGGQSLSTPQKMGLKQTFPNAKIVQTYACTEAASSITFLDVTTSSPSFTTAVTRTNDTDEERRKKEAQKAGGTCVGSPPPHIQVGIFVELGGENGSSSKIVMAVQPYQIGIIGTKGPHTMNGYYTRSHSSKRNVDRDTKQNDHEESRAWYLTNDIGYMDHNKNLYFCGRKSDTIRTGSETVYAPEVEKVLQQYTSLIKECVVFGLENEYFGEVVCAAIVLQENNPFFQLSPSLSESRSTRGINGGVQVEENNVMKEIIKKYCMEKNLAGYKRPRRLFLIFGGELPKNSSGKILKRYFVNQLKQKEKEKEQAAKSKSKKMEGNGDSSSNILQYHRQSLLEQRSRL